MDFFDFFILFLKVVSWMAFTAALGGLTLLAILFAFKGPYKVDESILVNNYNSSCGSGTCGCA